MVSVGQTGSYLRNDGIVAHSVSVEEFAVGGVLRARGETVSRFEARS